jgi:hypothetical protein
MTSSVFLRNRKFPPIPPGVSPAGFRSDPKKLALQCLADSRNDFDRAATIAARYVHGRKLRETIAAIATAVLLASAN